MPALVYTSSNFPFQPFTKIYSADVDQCFTDITTLLNTTKLDSTNIQAGGVATSNIASQAITTALLADANVTSAKFATGAVNTAAILDANVTSGKLASGAALANIGSGGITATYMASSINLPGNSVQENGKNVVVSGTNSGTSLAIVRGTVIGGALGQGEGFTASHTGTGTYSITFTNAFSNVPIITASPFNGSSVGLHIIITGNSSGGFTVSVNSADNTTQVDGDFMFIAIGPR